MQVNKRGGLISKRSEETKLSNRRREGFTLLEVLLVIALLGILAGIVIVALNPAIQIAKANNAQRSSDANTILNAVWQYSLGNQGSLPPSVLASADCSGTAAAEICKTGGDCTGLTDLSVLTINEQYVVSMPFDPTESSTNGAGYHVVKSVNGRVTVCAPSAELGQTVEISK
jgi:prepilin-type N-terminal cleavage/methylation domain-containing protein